MLKATQSRVFQQLLNSPLAGLLCMYVYVCNKQPLSIERA